MKVLFASDLHGSIYDAFTLIERIEAERPDKVVFLGDFCGFSGYGMLRDLLNRINAPIVYVEGNCDYKDGLSALNLESVGCTYRQNVNERKIFATHGHIYNRLNAPKDIDIMFYGHLHTPFIKKENGVLFVNVGSAAKPRNGTEKSYATFDKSGIYIKDIDFGEIISEVRF